MDEMAALDSKRAGNKNRDLANHFRTTGYMLQAPISFLQGVGNDQRENVRYSNQC